MECPACKTRLRVQETRDAAVEVYRTRVCDTCKWVVTTRESIINGEIPLEVIKPRDWTAINARRKERAKKEK